MGNPFEVLGIEQSASLDEIRKAYRELARRWHPDRFPNQAERLWAEEKMIRINVAYEEALSYQEAHASDRMDVATPEREQLDDVRSLLGVGDVPAARRALMKIATRSAEWNYLFGAVMLRVGEYEKAVLYFGIASRQKPQNLQYRAAYHSAEAIRDQKKTPAFLKRVIMALGSSRPAFRQHAVK